MDERDRNNLSFLINSAPVDIAAWYANATHEDLVYAQELLNTWQVELDAIAFNAMWRDIETALQQMESNFVEAKKVLKKCKKKIKKR